MSHPQTLTWRPLGPPDLPAIEALHRRAIGAAGPDVVKPEGPDFFPGILGGRGKAVGAFEGDHLIAYGILQHVLPDADDPRPLLGLPDSVLRVKLAGASVEPEARGRGLQRALIEERVALARATFKDTPILIYATSAPANVASWSNLMAANFTVRAVKLYYGGYPRYVMVHESVTQDLDGSEVILDPADLDGQRHFLAQGWRGSKMVRDQGGVRIAYTAPRPALRAAAAAERP
ncbi:hypothetical protein [Xanthobacter tagetidis]|jgi:GNAT superfamily N-acetyltransferase|uniref:N-acetyltransferase domain-containing protein n=1 Tax=Xanthobacter tagetidis TaxID=60216 RepID=A0A3L7AA16_9HYPH|nr:hypothetical protein [Xanthobacter tagetidis]MBB6309580.1 GNAT superfamily N-acetyltransferase [Xanthobacter tagetidis]RLP77133.1 hypothetical protein D9R14_14090 [Xanthobacter tagetidis]